jgi:hypothetical protein
MKSVLAALLLLVQLQPVLGTVVCVAGSERAPQQECGMSDARYTTASQVAPAGAAGHGCALAMVCMPALLAIPGASNRLEAAVPVYSALVNLGATAPRDISPATPFRPPRA